MQKLLNIHQINLIRKKDIQDNTWLDFVFNERGQAETFQDSGPWSGLPWSTDTLSYKYILNEFKYYGI